MAKSKIEVAKKDIDKRLKKMKDDHPFLLAHADKNAEIIIIEKPWGDESVALVAYANGEIHEPLFECLENVLLPEVYSAVYHKDKDELEIIWTAYKLDSESEEVKGRLFEFSYKGKAHRCEFRESSDRLLCLARRAAYLRISQTTFRNLQSFTQYCRTKEDPSDRLGEPTSFFIGGVGSDQEVWPDLLKHINFYLKYYDNKSPYIVMHETKEENLREKFDIPMAHFQRKFLPVH